MAAAPRPSRDNMTKAQIRAEINSIFNVKFTVRGFVVTGDTNKQRSHTLQLSRVYLISDLNDIPDNIGKCHRGSPNVVSLGNVWWSVQRADGKFCSPSADSSNLEGSGDRQLLEMRIKAIHAGDQPKTNAGGKLYYELGPYICSRRHPRFGGKNRPRLPFKHRGHERLPQSWDLRIPQSTRNTLIEHIKQASLFLVLNYAQPKNVG